MNEGRKYDEGKTRFDLVPPLAEEAVAEVMTYGALKYDEENWRYVANAKRRYQAAARRHMNAHRRGELFDAESGKPHLAHAAASLMMVLELELEELYHGPQLEVLASDEYMSLEGLGEEVTPVAPAMLGRGNE